MLCNRGVVQRLIILVVVLGLLPTACGSDSNTSAAAPQTDTTQETGAQPVVKPDQSAAQSLSSLIPASSPTPYASAMPLPTPSDTLLETYVVQPGDTLGGISLAHDVPMDELVALNGLESELSIIQIGQVLQVPLNVPRKSPQLNLIPDSEVVFSPAYLNFDVEAFVEGQGGYLSHFSSPVSGVHISGAEIVSRVARQYSVGPRILLTLLEYYGGWVTRAQPQTYEPLGPANPYYDDTFLLQLSWAANRVNEGYYGYKTSGNHVVRFLDRSLALVPAGLNAGTAGIWNILALNGAWETWQAEAEEFMAAYRRLFGDPFTYVFEPLVPNHLEQPTLRLPWDAGTTFYFTGGPHAAYGSHSAWAAVDFAPPDIKGSCYYSRENVVAAADGRIVLGETGEMYLDLDADGNLQTGWVLLYLHVVARDDIQHGLYVLGGAPIGYASCEGGIANSSHVHLARRFNGEWMAADGPVPLVLSGWQFKEGIGQYEGTAVRDGLTKTACECWDEVTNALTGE
jgi:LasA protease